jgi:hypothetical protein
MRKLGQVRDLPNRKVELRFASVLLTPIQLLMPDPLLSPIAKELWEIGRLFSVSKLKEPCSCLSFMAIVENFLKHISEVNDIVMV